MTVDGGSILAVTVFLPEDDVAYYKWLTDHQYSGYVLAWDKPSYNRLHFSWCKSISGPPSESRKRVTAISRKACSSDLGALWEWALSNPDSIKTEVVSCKHCRPPNFQGASHFELSFQEQVTESLAEPAANRRKRLKAAPSFPEKKLVLSSVFVRNSDVVAEVLIRANGKCERCKCLAPFVRRTNGTPYLEVHHSVPLADGGEDTVDNAVALCPNCHRQLHHG